MVSVRHTYKTSVWLLLENYFTPLETPIQEIGYEIQSWHDAAILGGRLRFSQRILNLV